MKEDFYLDLYASGMNAEEAAESTGESVDSIRDWFRRFATEQAAEFAEKVFGESSEVVNLLHSGDLHSAISAADEMIAEQPDDESAEYRLFGETRDALASLLETGSWYEPGVGR